MKVLVYKVDNPIQSSLSSSLVLTLIQSFIHWSTLRSLNCNIHKSKHHHHFTWYYKANPKTNPPRLETKHSKLYSHLFKCLNYKGNHQADLNQYPFWRHHFNREWYTKKYQELYDNRKQSICSVVNSNQAWFWTNSKFFLWMFAKTTSSSIWS